MFRIDEAPPKLSCSILLPLFAKMRLVSFMRSLSKLVNLFVVLAIVKGNHVKKEREDLLTHHVRVRCYLTNERKTVVV